MKKHLVATLLVAVMCLLTLSACSVVAGLEKDVNITLNVNGNALDGNYVVNTFNNAIVPVPEAPKGDVFLGWTADKDWQNKDIADVALSQNKGLIRYDDVKDYAVDGKITLYAVFGVQPRHDIAVAWYDKEKTSGLNQGVMDEFLTALKAFLTTQGYTPDSMDIVVRGYAGNVGPTCGAIMDDGDIDIMVGWAAASNIEGTGGMKRGVDFLQNYGNITLTGASKARYTAKLSDSEVVNKVYQWILSTYAGEGGATKDYDVADTPVVPDPDPTPDPGDIVITDNTLVVSVWNKPDGSWISTEQLEKLKTDFAAYLTEHKVDVSTLHITWRVEEDTTNVAALVASVKAAGDVDFVLACGNNVNSSGNLENLEKIAVPDGTYMTANRMIAVLNKDNPRQLAKILWEFVSGTKFPEAETPVDPDPTPTPDPEPTPDTSVDYGKKLTVSIWNNTKGGWITEEQIAKLKTDFEAYLTEKGLDVSTLSITWRVETDVTNVAALVAAVKAAGDVDFVLACGKNVNSDGNLTNLEKLQVAESPYMAANRYIAVLNKDNPRLLAKVLYKFISGQDYPESDTALTITDKELTVSIWNNKKGEWITTEQIDKLKADFESYLTSKGVDLTTITINWKVETDVTNVAALVNSVNNSEKTVDFVLACGNNVNSDGNLTNLEKIKLGSTDYMTDGRFIALLHKDKPNQLATLLWQFMYEQVFVASTQGGAE
ncbi:MAG TPA: hypothetical protein DHU79_01660 [Clostridiales bacterium]|nr:hypothetical protein [Clostridiales bacterium]